ncbi:hypothetical protein BO94DRAFT_538793 [Aspergillus sclerotioniger CBS 115572]|uniref:Uncharacterized protein n=1 Tax=Aspergillus sclerotioniger CBS 115572 TaxID=1450535 RepID=A0A317VHG6_9EURO|nr:hypothetical protein BO94DRAFT_538793 [Aspergillus sclerotioniger CBS 115572]PWY73753.1 hypothetical protein BO94DRAFT_538793 [Aspergillus sclerotioniger CBS 115572]
MLLILPAPPFFSPFVGPASLPLPIPIPRIPIPSPIPFPIDLFPETSSPGLLPSALFLLFLILL